MKNKRKKVLTGQSDRLEIEAMNKKKKRKSIIDRLYPVQTLNLSALMRSGALK